MTLLIIQDQFGITQSLQRFLIPQISNWLGAFLDTRYSKTALVRITKNQVNGSRLKESCLNGKLTNVVLLRICLYMNLSRVRIERPPVASRNNNSLSGKYKNRVALVEISSTQQLFSMNSLFTHIRNYNSNYIFPIFFMISTAFACNFARKKSQQNCQATQNNNIHIVWKIQKKRLHQSKYFLHIFESRIIL